MIDLHCHVLPGIDDGPASIEGSVALARAAAAGGTRVLVATPHVNWRYRNDAETITEPVAELNARLVSEEVLSVDGRPLEVRGGAEIALTQIPEIAPAELERLALGGGRWLLVEPPFTPIAPNLDDILLELQRNGRRIVLAHPERCPAFQRKPEMVKRLVQAGALTSVTAGSLTGQFGNEARRFALALWSEGLLHNVASDAHDGVQRPPLIAAHLEQSGLGSMADWLTRLVPTAILDGGEIPPRPAVASTGREQTPRRRWHPLRN